MNISAKIKKASKKWSAHPRVKHLRKVTGTKRFGRIYAIAAVVVLALTTLLWSLLGARLQGSNADQLINAQLLANGHTFAGAELPGQHTFLFKLPLFYLIKLAHYTPLAYIVVTVATVLLTVALFAYIIYKIDRRPLVFGTVMLGMAHMLLLVPTVPYSGALLPVNMAMVTTRNLEYILYIVSVLLFIRAKSMKTVAFWSGVALLAVLSASDKLYLVMSIASALFLIVAYSKARNSVVTAKAFNWFIGGLVAAVLTTVILALVSAVHVAHISTKGVGPYGLTTTTKDIVLGTFYGLTGILSNTGANPVYDAVELKQLPSKLVHHLFSFGGVGFLVNLVMSLSIVWLAFRLVQGTMTNRKKQQVNTDEPVLLALALISSAVAALGQFVATEHYYAVDARYLGISFFAFVVVAAAWLHTKKRLHTEKFAILGAVLLISCLLGSASAFVRHNDDAAAIQSLDSRNQTIAQALAVHHVGALVGDYWRVIPTKFVSKKPLNIMPLADCVTPRQVLTSTVWQPDLHHMSFAYLLTFNGSLTDFPNCSLKQVEAIYGRPNASYLVSGSLAHPDELLLFYDRGITPPPRANRTVTTSVLPTPLLDMPNMQCNGPTTMNIVAHQDDDLLFLSPDLLHDVQSKRCVRTVYITAGDAGNDQPYWLSREQGSEAAYSAMLGTNELWIQRIVSVSSHAYITIANPRGNPRVSLVFMHLPDGNVQGQGFGATRHESLASLMGGRVDTMTSVDSQSRYTKTELVDTLTQLMNVYDPTEIHTQSTINGTFFTDHSDHVSVGHFATLAYNKYETDHYGGEVTIPITYYRGYSIHENGTNISGTDLEQKEAAFFAYGHFDGSVCHDDEQCRYAAYGAYLPRQYPESH